MARRAPGAVVPERPSAGLPSIPERGRPGAARARVSLWVAALCALPLTLLAVASWFGRWVRPSGDEWCFLPVVREDGLWGLVDKFWFHDNGRLVNAVLVGSYAEFGVSGHQWFPLISGVLMLGILWAVVVSALRAASWTAPRGIPLLVAATVTALFLFASPNTYKTFYWPAASVSHTLPPVLACAAVLPLLRARTQGGRRLAAATVFVAGVLMGTLSEETSVVALGVLCAVLLLSGRLVAAARRPFLRAWCLAGAAGTAVGTLLLVTSPGSRTRRERYDVESAGMLSPDSLIGSLQSFAHIITTLLTTWQYLGAVAVGLLLGLLVTGPDGRPPERSRHRRLVARTGVLTLLGCGFLCTVIAYPVFGRGVEASTRLWNDYLLLFIALLLGAGVLLGRALRERGRPVRPALAAGAAVCALVCVGLAVPLWELQSDMRERAHAWEDQDRRLREGAASGERVLPYKPLVISKMTEPFGRQGRRPWPARCVADYYGLESITHARRLP